ncbi:non-ribosomal peptide synthetase [Nocardiopsis sp. FIRDI 009]|uniref:non-ribosomal peptide synthetase n=1 Tax=Nocardiopsis sp. FIRDI 009 TaxID=714197 RepID=UPI000E272274|nr:non-ribosomal peptide synthetase [Nocardiopsis sp. FIRDI 009]
MTPDTAHDLFSLRAREAPDSVAVVSGGRRTSYRELAQDSDRLALRLRAAGVRPGDPVALLMERSTALFTAVLAVLKAGACYLPLHDAHPDPRLERILERAGRPLVLADRASVSARPELTRGALVVDDGGTARAPGTADTAAAPTAEVSPDSPAYVMFTSGSSGEPKGVCVSHSNVLDFVRDPCWDTGHHLRVLMVAPHAFSVSTYEVLVPLLRGGTVVVAPPGPVGVTDLRRLLREHEITGLHLTAGLFRVVAEEDPDCLAPVREVLTGGDVVSADAVRRVMTACPDVVVRTTYGATETTLFTVSAPVPEPPDPGTRLPVGRPMAGVDARILDEEGRPVPKGVTGELHLSGPRLSLGYLGRPDLTDERFTRAPDGSGRRTFRTGDLARWTDDGMIQYVGRMDQQVKIRGFRVEPGEVEAILSGMPEVAHATVVPREFRPGDTRLAAYVVPAAGRVVDLDEARALLRSLLPDYMVPAGFAVMSALPLTPNGKVDRAALPPVTADRGGGRETPRTATEKTVCALFADVIGARDVGPDDDFFQLGGQSLLAVRLLNRLEAETGVALGVNVLLDSPTVSALAAEVDRRVTGVRQ